MLKSKIQSMLTREQMIRLRSNKRKIKSYFTTNTLDKELINKKKILIMGVADYNNLGDHAIAHAQRNFLDKLNSESKGFTVIEISSGTPSHHVAKIINDNDIILFTGGGNLGTMYEFMSDTYLPMLKKFPNNKKLFFPQSYTFNDKGDSAQYKHHIQEVFKQCGKTLTIVARETKSKRKFEATFPENNVILTPDIVLSVTDRNDRESKRNGVVVMLREDGEKVLDMKTQNALIDALKTRGKVTLTDTVVDELIPISERHKALTDKWDMIQNSKVVVTDRLHGMIFAKITGTPCVVFDNYNSKIQMTCNDWLKDDENIVFVDHTKAISIPDVLETISNLTGAEVEPFDVDSKYAPLEHALKEMLG